MKPSSTMGGKYCAALLGRVGALIPNMNFTLRLATLPRLISVRFELFPLGELPARMSQFCGSLAEFKSRSYVTSAAFAERQRAMVVLATEAARLSRLERCSHDVIGVPPAYVWNFS